MALTKTTKTSFGINGEYLRIMYGNYVASGHRFQVTVGIYINEAHRQAEGSKPLECFTEIFDCAYEADNPVASAYSQLKTGFTPFDGAEDC